MLICPDFTLSNTLIQEKKSLLLNFSPKQVRSCSSSGNRSIRIKRNLVEARNSAAMQQKITIPNKRGEKLVGVLHETGLPKLVVLCHGFRSTKEYDVMVNLAAALEQEGISAFRFDFAGNGESEGSFQFGNYISETEDLRSVVEYFTGVNRSTVVVVGHSKGGNVVLLYASKYHDIGAVVNVSGRYDVKRGIAERLGKNFLERLKKDGYIDVKTRTGEVDYRVTEESMMERLNTNMHEACLSIDGKCRVLTVHGSADEVIPVEDALEFAKIIPNHRLQIIEGANHGYSSHQDQLTSTVLPFIKECIQQAEDHVSN
ncbi:putative esterase [Handroanthus impetiginosus]|uniref:Putative esterase n=1 Tax=Handroanthus impetiginosus TaxID=429701 RepID=A0A2G9GYG1_9LAMI|nr:putative esterase [Handroanthus impetiginosus]